MSDSDPARDYEVLRAETAQMLNLDLADLSPADGLRLDLTSLLRLSLDSLQGIALSGQEVDLSRLQSCYAMLSKLLPQAVEAPARPAVNAESVRARFSALIDRYVVQNDWNRNEQIEALEAEVARLKETVAGKDATIRALSGAAPPAPPASAPPQQQSPQPPLPPPSSAPPAHYLRGPDEPWRVYEGGRDRWSNRG